jgi:8-oxo-dGTP diphosphatase
MPHTFYVGLKGVVTLDDKVLLMKKEDQLGKMFWDIPGGRMEQEETIHQALEREMKEEIPTINGFKVGELMLAYRLDRDLKDGSGLMLLFYELEAEPFEASVSEEHLEFKWFTLQELDTIADSDTYIGEGYLQAAKRSLTN